MAFASNDILQGLQLFMCNSKINELVIRIKASDKEAFKYVFQLYHQSIFNFLIFKLKHAEVAEDLLQDVFLKLWQNRSGLDETKSLQSYLYTIASHLSFNHHRNQQVRTNYITAQPLNNSELISPLFLLESKELEHAIAEAIQQLPEKVRIVFLMHRVENRSYKEIALCLGITVKTVESHISKALRLMRERLKELNEEIKENIRVKQ